ncbi:MAG: hypothetical protein BGP04_03825 [Rhizobiales bacterium 62-17]|nr:DUF72 domain-containing protein [Hyphomicrobiales bacterium]OJY04522.1 MAG: hypothetical protein BGP04_03825 [Rhizobiales bacterium 62-17]
MAKAAKANIRIGVGGWTFEPWRGTFYPDGLTQKRELEYASRHLTSIEINGTYYGSQKRDSFIKWHNETPEGFIFSMKGTRFSTNRRVLAEAGDSVARFLGSGVAELKSRLGPVNWQFHPSKKFDAADMGAFLALLPKTIEDQPLRHVIEVRNDSFSTPDFIELARQHGVAVVCAAGNSYLQIADRTADFVYARITITDEKVKGGFTAATIEKWAEAARAWAAGDIPKGMTPIAPLPKTKTPPTDVFIYIIGGHKERNPAAAQALIEKLA